MSDVLIKGMEMPKNCDSCRIMVLEDTNCVQELFCGCPIVFKAHPQGEDKRPDYCPLVPVPPHGRLIDGDKLAEEQKENVGAYHANLITLDDLAEFLLMQSISEDYAPTIIPASEEET